MLTNAAVKAARPGALPYKLADGRGLHLYVAPNGRRSWRMKCRFAGRELLLTFGQFPDLSLAEARARCEAARELKRRGVDPRGAPVNDDLPTFEATAREWFEQRRERWSAEHAGDVIASLERHVFSAIGAVPLVEIDAPTVLELLQAVERGGAIETARRLRQRISAVYAFAIARKRADDNPAAQLAGELAALPAVRKQPALTSINDARDLLAAAHAVAGAAIVKLASRFLALTAVRLAAVRGMTWVEVEGLDGDTPLWRVPAARMKLRKAQKASATFDHLVPLAPAAVAVLRQAREIHHAVCASDGAADDTQRVFPIAKGSIGALYDRAGYVGRHVPHGWRATFSTILNEAMPQESDAIDQALAHAPKDKVEAAYNRAEHLDRRRRLFTAWAAMLTGRGSGR